MMSVQQFLSNVTTEYIDTPFLDELKAVKAESIGWLPLGPGVYLHQGITQPSNEDFVVRVVGIADAELAGMNVLLLV